MPENFTVPMPGKGADEVNRAGELAGTLQAAPQSAQGRADCVRQKASEMLRLLPADAKNWSADARGHLARQLSDLAGELRLLGCGQALWKPVLELATSLGRLTPNGAFPPLPRGPQLERLKKVLGALAADDGPLATPAPATASQSARTSEIPDIPYTRMLLKKLGSD